MSDPVRSRLVAVIRVGLSVILATTLIAASARAQRIDAVGVANRLAGCWSVSVGPYQPPIGPDSVFGQPPDLIEFDSIHGTGPVPGGRWPLHPAGHASRNFRISDYTVISADSIMMNWSTGFSGPTIRARLGPDTLRGVASMSWDFTRVSQRAAAMLVRLTTGRRCPTK